MHRFFLTVTLAAAAVIILSSEYRKGTVAPPADKVAVAPAVTPAPVTPPAAAKVEPKTAHAAAPAKVEPKAEAKPAHAATPARSEPKVAQNPAPAQGSQPAKQQVATAPAAAPAKETPAQVDVVSYGASHTTSSASVSATEEEFIKLSLVDQKSAVQRELARLGCYGAKVDGLWGRKSMAAVKAFNKQSGANLKAWPSAKLAKVLRAAPDGACTVASLKGKGTGGTKGADNPHLPIWVREARLASADPKAIAAEASPAPAAKSAERSMTARKSGSRRVAYRPAYGTVNGWALKDWPGTAR